MTLVALLTLTAAQAQTSDNGKDQQACCKDKQECCKKDLKHKPHKKFDRKPMTPQMQTERMASRLNLSAEQKEKVLKLNTEYKDMMAPPAMQKDQRPEKADMEKMKAQRTAYGEQLKQILTEEQYQEFQKMKPRHHGPHGHGPKGGKPAEKSE